jgi:hypothetical protein
MDAEHTARAAAVQPSVHNPLDKRTERQLQAAPFVAPMAFPLSLADVSRTALYGTVSQSVLVQCRSEGCVLYAYREVVPTTTSDDGADGAAREAADAADSVVLSPWTWTRVPLPAAPTSSRGKRPRADDGCGGD